MLLELENLEEKINKAVELIQKLNSNNQQLKEKNEDLLKQVNEQEIEIQKFTEETQNSKENEESLFLYKEKEEKIRIKIQQMLEKLDSFEKLVNNN